MPEQSSRAANQQQTFLILWVVLAVSQLVYLGIPVPEARRPADASFLTTMAMALGFVSLSTVGVIWFFFSKRTVGAIAQRTLDPRTSEGAEALFVSLIVSWVLAESIAIYGFVLRFMHAPSPLWLPFAILGAGMMYYTRPWQSALTPPLSTAERAASSKPLV